MSEATSIFQKQQQARERVAALSCAERISLLTRLKDEILARKQAIIDALQKDYGKHPAEVELTELYTTIAELKFAIRNLKRWMKPVRVRTPLSMFGTSSEIRCEPKGVVLIIGPWNYPFSLVMIPLVSAIAAGNCVIAKPSELTPHLSSVLKEIVAAVFDASQAVVLEGDATVAGELLSLPFNHIFFTGSIRVGKIVAEAAAKHLTPVTLELGGKSPVIIERSADLKAAAERVVWGKFVNSGQTCVAPDYVLLPEERMEEFGREAAVCVRQLFQDAAAVQQPGRDYCRIINQRNYDRLKAAIGDAVSRGAVVETGNVFNDAERSIAPTILKHVPAAAELMAEEIFGPALPLLAYKDLEEVYSFISARSTPLALYVFSTSPEKIEEILRRTRAGGSCVNNTLAHLLNPRLPFGGSGESGIGSYHGYAGFKTFSHERSVLYQRFGNLLKLMYPPYRRSRTMIQLALRWLT